MSQSHAYDGDDSPLPFPDECCTPEKDKPMTYDPPEYRLAGASMATENVIECGKCGALLKEGNAFLHSHWHERMNNPKVTY